METSVDIVGGDLYITAPYFHLPVWAAPVRRTVASTPHKDGLELNHFVFCPTAPTRVAKNFQHQHRTVMMANP